VTPRGRTGLLTVAASRLQISHNRTIYLYLLNNFEDFGWISGTKELILPAQK